MSNSWVGRVQRGALGGALAMQVACAPALLQHSGGTNADGCHNETATGGYHCHNGGLSGGALVAVVVVVVGAVAAYFLYDALSAPDPSPEPAAAPPPAEPYASESIERESPQERAPTRRNWISPAPGGLFVERAEPMSMFEARDLLAELAVGDERFVAPTVADARRALEVASVADEVVCVVIERGGVRLPEPVCLVPGSFAAQVVHAAR